MDSFYFIRTGQREPGKLSISEMYNELKFNSMNSLTFIVLFYEVDFCWHSSLFMKTAQENIYIVYSCHICKMLQHLTDPPTDTGACCFSQAAFPVQIHWHINWGSGHWGQLGSSTTPRGGSWTAACGAQVSQRTVYYQGMCRRSVWIFGCVFFCPFGSGCVTNQLLCSCRGGRLQLVLHRCWLPCHKGPEGPCLRGGTNVGKDRS